MISNELIDAEFPQRSDVVHLNHAGVSPWPARTGRAIKDFADENVVHGPAAYTRWVEKETTLRKQLQALINAPSTDDIALVKNTSEGLSMIAGGLDWREGDNIVSSDQEFPSNRIVWEALRARGVALRQAGLYSAASPEDALFSQVDERTRMIAISSVQYASGLRMDLERIGAFCRDHGLLFCIDAIQSLGALPLDAQAIHADFVVADGHKWLLAPEGLAVFYVREAARERLHPTQFGWHMVEHAGDYDRQDWRPAASARRYECGSPNMLGIHGLSASLSLLLECGLGEVRRRVLDNSDYLRGKLGAVPGITLVSDPSPTRQSGIVAFRHARISPGQLHRGLMRAHVLCALRGGAVRFSPHFYTPRERMDHAVGCVAAICESPAC